MGLPPVGGGTHPSSRAWLIPMATGVAVGVGFLAAFYAQILLSPSGWIGPLPGSTTQGIDPGLVTNFFGAPLAAAAAALIAYCGIRLHRPVALAIAGAAGGIATYVTVGVECVSLGNWWLYQLPTDTNLTAAMLTLLLCPPAILALLLSAGGALAPPTASRKARALQFVGLGAVAGLFLGAFYGGEAAAVTWAISCSPSPNCFTLSTVINSGELVGSVIGLVAGLALGGIAYAIRLGDSGLLSGSEAAPAAAAPR